VYGSRNHKSFIFFREEEIVIFSWLELLIELGHLWLDFQAYKDRKKSEKITVLTVAS